MKIIPFFNTVLIEPLEAEEKTIGGLYIPDETQEKMKPHAGKVLAVGEAVNPLIQVGDTVLYKKWAGDEVTLEGKTVVMAEDKDILGKQE